MFVKERMSGWPSSLCCIQSLWFILERLFLFFLLIHCLEYTSVHPCLFSVCLFKSLYLPSLWNNSLTTFSDIFLSEFYRSLRHPSFGTRTECNQVPVFHCFLGLGLMAPWKQGVGPFFFFFFGLYMGDTWWGEGEWQKSGARIGRSKYVTWFCPLTFAWSWPSHLTSLSLSFPSFKIGINSACHSGVSRIKWGCVG